MKLHRPIEISVRRILMLSFMLLILLPYLITSVYYTVSMHKQLRSEMTAQLASDCDLLLRGLDMMLAETQRVAYLHLLDSEIARILETEHRAYDLSYYTDERIMTGAIKHATNLNTNILSVTFYARGGNVYQLNHLAVDNQLPLPAMDGDQRVLVGAAQDGAGGGRGKSLPIYYALYNSMGDQHIGTVRIDYNLMALLSATLSQGKSGAHFAVAQDGVPLMDTGGQWDQLSSPGAQGAGSARAGGGALLTYRAVHTSTRLVILTYSADDPMASSAMRSIFWYLMVLAALLLVALLLSYLLSRHLGNSVSELSHAMNHAQHGQSDPIAITTKALARTELDGLKTSYNAMVDRLASSARREYEIRSRQKTVAMRALESQVNPHFLYNALNLIASLAQLAHQQTIRSVAISLASMLRYSIKGGSMVTLQEELSETRHYINIIKLRFPDRIVVNTSVDPQLLGVEVPKLLLQPLLENSSKYATDTAALMVTLEIGARSDEGGLLMWVSDNGPGIPEDTLAALRKRIASYSVDDVQQDGERSIGLINVHARVRARYGEPYGIHIDSSPDGCTIFIRLPAATP